MGLKIMVKQAYALIVTCTAWLSVHAAPSTKSWLTILNFYHTACWF